MTSSTETTRTRSATTLRAPLAWTALAAAALTLSCSSLGSSRPAASADEQAALVAAETSQGTVDLEAFIEKYPNSSLADDAAWLLALRARDDGDMEQAERWLNVVIQRYSDEDRADSARLALAEIEHARGNDPASRSLLARLRLTQMTDKEQQRAYQLLADTATSPLQRLRWLAPMRAKAVAGEDFDTVAGIDREIDVLLEGMPVADLEQASEKLDEQIPAARAQLVLAERALDAGELEDASRFIDRATEMELAPEYEDRIEQILLHLELRDQIYAQKDRLPTFADVAKLPPPRTEGANGSVGVVLPLSGPFALYGEQSLKGILLAARIFDETGVVASMAAEAGDTGSDFASVGAEPSLGAALEEATGVRVVVRDSGGTAEGAARAVRELADDERVSAIVGPLLSGESEAAGREAEAAGIPLIALTSREEVPRERENVFRLRTTPSDEVTHLVDLAMDQRGARRFAILYPQDNYGRGMRLRFWQAVDRRGGHVVAVSSYDPKATDFAASIRRMIGYELLTRDEQVALEERADTLRRARRLEPEEAAEVRIEAYEALGPEGDPLPPIIDFDALFIPDSHQNVVLVTPQLAFHEITGVQLLGPGAWVHPDLVRIGRNHVRGAIISAPFHAESNFVFVSRFVERYTTTYGQEPDLFAAQAFDAANLVLVQLAAGRDSREDVRDGVLRTQGYPGVSGVTTFMSDGNARKRPYMLGVRRGEIISLD